MTPYPRISGENMLKTMEALTARRAEIEAAKDAAYEAAKPQEFVRLDEAARALEQYIVDETEGESGEK